MVGVYLVRSGIKKGGGTRVRKLLKRQTRLLGYVFFVIFAAAIIFITSCSAKVTMSSVDLKFAPDFSILSATNVVTGFIEEESSVLRCYSITETADGIKATTSKSKSMAASTLVFISNPENTSQDDSVWVATVPVTGKEYEYDMSNAKYYKVTYTSANAATQDYGIMFPDWQTGAVSDSEQFPCCE